MMQPFPLARLVLLSTAAILPSAAFAQESPSTSSGPTPPVSTEAATPTAVQTSQPGDLLPEQAPAEEPDVSVPGAAPPVEEIVVRGRRNVARSTPEVVSVLSIQDIARTGEGNIAGSLQRVTGLSVVGNGFVYVRGLGDRYSLALLNGSPLPSPEPMRRAVPLDLFPTNVVASSLVQKTYSPTFTGEFGGGVINVTTV